MNHLKRGTYVIWIKQQAYFFQKIIFSDKILLDNGGDTNKYNIVFGVQYIFWPDTFEQDDVTPLFANA